MWGAKLSPAANKSVDITIFQCFGLLPAVRLVLMQLEDLYTEAFLLLEWPLFKASGLIQPPVVWRMAVVKLMIK